MGKESRPPKKEEKPLTVLKIPQQARERVNPQPQSEGVGRAQRRYQSVQGSCPAC